MAPSHWLQTLTEATKDLAQNASTINEQNKLCSTLEQFKRAPKKQPKLLVIGCTGSGKSTLLNILAGFKFQADVDQTDFNFTCTRACLCIFI